MKILIISSAKIKNKPIINLFSEIKDSVNISIASPDKKLRDSFPRGGSILFGPSEFFFYGLPFLVYAVLTVPIYLVFLSIKKYKNKIDAIVCMGERERILLSLPAKILGTRNIWLFFPEKTKNIGSAIFYPLAKLSSLAISGCFTSSSRNYLIKKGFKEKNTFLIPPAADTNYNHQENIFNKIAAKEISQNFFSIGAVINFSDKEPFETLLKAVKNCQNSIPNIRLIVIGADEERRNLNWLSQKMGIERNVWFVGAQGDLIKWFNDFDIYFSLSSEPNLFDIETVLLAMSRGVPATVLHHESFSDIIIDNETGFMINDGGVEELSKKLEQIEDDRDLLKKIGINGKSLANEKMNREQQAKAFMNLFKI